ncbi:MAG TPA: DUF3467 domain-containing protein [Candidatus Methylomirabilis sp.]|nr:DUF3467 domain-containing protein [Candidatus Methylomirabilis sp.]
MAGGQNKDAGATPPVSATTAPRLRWDDSRVRSGHANVCNATSTREEIVLLFGVKQAWQAGQAEIPIQLTDRIILSPFVAKRLAVLLTNVVREYETRFGSLDVVAPPSTTA